MAEDDRFDAVWRPENDPTWGWIPTRYVPALLPGDRPRREEDGRWHGENFLRTSFTLQAQCQDRCDVLNREG